MKLLVHSLALVLIFSFISVALAKAQVSGEIQAYVVSINEDGKELRRLATEAAPGQVLEIEIVFTNHGDASVKGVKVVDAIPVNTTFINDSNSTEIDAEFEVSIDGGKTYELTPVVRIQQQEDGSDKEIVIPPNQYTHVRWVAQQSLSSKGGQHQYSYRVTVE